NNSCCLLSVADRGKRIRSEIHTSKQKEQLNAKQLFGYLYQLLKKEIEASMQPIRHIVMHRDGRSWPSEIAGARRAIEKLRSESLLPEEANLTVVEIHKKSSVPLRLVTDDSAHGRIQKPHIGNAVVVGSTEGFVCTTGWPFSRPGTPNPLQILRAAG